ncbi:MAG: valine--tRNA ligase, partial [Bacteroidetes bacterium]|nr:valine--tRNA ligase [Bacteroidota bacterium]
MEALAKTYDPTQYEDKWYAHWRKQGFFRSKPDKRKAYTIVIPPPNVTGILHMGHMLNNTLQDVLIRRKRMEGYNSCWVPGTDHASIATEAKVVRMLADQGIRKEDLGREGFLEKALEWKDKYGGIILKQLEKLGASCDWDRTRFTMEPGYYQAVIDVFTDLYNKGLIYRGYRMINWDPQARTSLSDEEVVMKEKDGMLYHLRYRFADSPGEYLTVATTRPETIMVDVAVAVNPSDERYQALLGQQVIIPGTDTHIPIIADDYVDPAFGTGCLKVTPAHDTNDYQIGLRHKLPIRDVLNEDGTLNTLGGKYAGMDRFAVRKQIVRDLKEQELLEKEEPTRHAVGHSERTDAVIEPRLTHQWFLNMKEMARLALDAVEHGEVSLIPDRFRNTYRHWLENVQDWNISRQLWWGHRIPAWFFDKPEKFVVARTREEALTLARAQGFTANAEELRQDPDVLDTWFSSWLWPIAVFDPTVFCKGADGNYPAGNADLQYYYPTDDLVTAPEILFFWVARMIMAGKTWDSKQRAPFRNVYLTGIVRDKQRRKMSKSLGNSPDPLDLIAQYGA